MSDPVIHLLKTWPVYYDAVESGAKTFDVRRDDRGFQKGDIVILQRTREDRVTEVDWNTFHEPKLGERHKAAHELVRRISWILTGGQFGIEPGFVVLALEKISPNLEEIVLK